MLPHVVLTSTCMKAGRNVLGELTQLFASHKLPTASFATGGQRSSPIHHARTDLRADLLSALRARMQKSAAGGRRGWATMRAAGRCTRTRTSRSGSSWCWRTW